MARKDWQYVPVKNGLCDFLDDYLTTDEAYRFGFKHKGDLVEELVRRWQMTVTGTKTISINFNCLPTKPRKNKK